MAHVPGRKGFLKIPFCLAQEHVIIYLQDGKITINLPIMLLAVALAHLDPEMRTRHIKTLHFLKNSIVLQIPTVFSKIQMSMH